MSRSKVPPEKSSSLREVSLFHLRQGNVFETVRRLARELEQQGIDYAVVGGLAVGELGYARATTDVDVLMTPNGLAVFRERCVGRGYLPAFTGAMKSFRDTETRVLIEVLTTGDFPGDGKPKPVAFPDPSVVAVSGEDFRFIRLESLLELKLASGLSAPHRLRDLADVQDLIFAAKLPRNLARTLDPSVQEEFLRLWEIAQTVPPPE
jgi:hypothetical protein